VIGERWGDSARTQGDPGRIQGDSGEIQGGLGDFEWEIPENEFLGQLEEIQGDGRYKGDTRSLTGDIARFAIGDPEKTQEDAWRFVHGDPGWEV
jgi:hypothetical protein